MPTEEIFVSFNLNVIRDNKENYLLPNIWYSFSTNIMSNESRKGPPSFH